MKAKIRDDGKVDLTGVPRETYEALMHLAGDLGAGACVLRYNPKLYSDAWVRPIKPTRARLVRFANLTGEFLEFFDHFEETEKPKFRKVKP